MLELKGLGVQRVQTCEKEKKTGKGKEMGLKWKTLAKNININMDELA